MTATEFQIAPALQPLHAGGVHICLAEKGGFEPSRPFNFTVVLRFEGHFDFSGELGLVELESAVLLAPAMIA
jgi:hypothetical protein